MAITVTATQGGSTANGMALRVMVLTSAAATQNGGTASANSNQQATVTTTQVGSRPYGACTMGQNSSLTANANTTLIDNIADATNSERYGTFKATATTSSPGATSIGATNGKSGGAAVLEVLQNGTLTEDSSAPAVVSTTSAHTVTTASFTPPSGALLVALVGSDGGVSTTTMTVSGGSLTWTEKIKANASGADYAGVWTAQVAGGTTYDADVSETVTETTTATGLLKPAVAAASETVTATRTATARFAPAVAAVSKTVTATVTAAGLLKPAVAAASETFTATVTADATVTGGGGTTYDADVSKTVTAATTATGLLKPAKAAVSKTVTATVTAAGLLKPAKAAATQSVTATVTADLTSGAAPTFPALLIEAQFTTGVWTDITAYVRQGTVTRPGTRLQGPVWTYQAGTASLTLKNTDGRFDPDNTSSPYWGSSGATRTATFLATGTWTCPDGVTSIDTVDCTGAGGGGAADSNVSADNGGGGGGGERAIETNVAVTPRTVYTVTVGAGGAGGAKALAGNAGSAGGNTSAAFDAVTVTAHGGSGGGVNTAGPTAGPGGAGGTGSSNTTHHNGGAGAAGASVGGGGGSSAGPAAAGNAGSGSTGGAAVTGGGPGGTGATGGGDVNGHSPANGPGGGGGGADSGTALGAGAAGQSGQATLTYTVSVAQTQVLPMVPIRVQATSAGITYTLFTGYADAWTDPGDNYAGNYDEVTVTATDAFKVFSNTTLAALVAPVGAGEDSGARVSRILDAAGWSSSARTVDSGDTTVQATSYDSDVMSLLQLTADTELGELYIDGSGNLVYRHRLALLEDTRSNTVQGVFGDSPGTVETAGTELEYTQVSRAEDDTTLVNDCQITAANGGVLQEATDDDSIAKYLYPRTYTRDDLLLQSDLEALTYAQWIVYVGAAAENRFDVLTLTPGVDPASLYPQALGREIGDRIQIWRRPPNVSAVTKDCFIQGISHNFTPLFWQTQWTLQSAAKYGSFFTLDNATLGKLDAGNAMAY